MSEEPDSPDLYEVYKHDCRDLDAVVFVHGFRGHYKKTWGKFPALVDADHDLPAMDLLLLGYSTGYRPCHPDIDRVGRGLMTAIRELVPNASRVVVVCHSMGGVGALAGVLEEMEGGRANGDPVGRIDRFVLFGTPLKGTHLATFAKHFGLGILYWLRLMNAQLRQLANGDFQRKFEDGFVNNIYKVEKDSEHQRRIPIHVCFGEKDWVVNRHEARSVIRDPASDSLEHGHFAMKTPRDRKDLRYKALKTKLLLTATAWRQLRCAERLGKGSWLSASCGDVRSSQWITACAADSLSSICEILWSRMPSETLLSD